MNIIKNKNLKKKIIHFKKESIQANTHNNKQICLELKHHSCQNLIKNKQQKDQNNTNQTYFWMKAA